MPTLLLRFPGRRYHATPWGHHVNEGLIEWPPSPWRVLRALLSVGYTACGWPGDIARPWRSDPPDAARALVLALAGVAPRYRLPPAVGTHSRHFMPMAEFKDGRERTALVFDTWAQVDDGELAITWDVDLAPSSGAMLAELADRMNYLGRSESWVQARLATPQEEAAQRHDCIPSGPQAAAAPGPDWEQVALLAPSDPGAYADWRKGAVDLALQRLPPLNSRGRAADKREAEREAARQAVPADLLACLQVDTSWLRQHGWSQPPGSRQLLYWRRSDALRPPAAHGAGAVPPDAVACVLLSMRSETLNDHALPVLARSLPQAEHLHRQALGVYGRLSEGGHSPVLSGCDAQGRPLRGAHAHAHLLPLDLDGDGHLDHVLAWAPAGLPALEQQALRRLRSTFTKGGVGPLRLAWVGAGALPDLLALPGVQGDGMRRCIGPGAHWISATPFVPPRHLKPRGAHTLEGQVRAELAARGLPAPRSVRCLDARHSDHARQLRHHVRSRRFGPPPPMDCGFALRLSFDQPVRGPICLGYGSHFGLGRLERDPSNGA